MQLQVVQITSCTLTNTARILQKEVYLPHLRYLLLQLNTLLLLVTKIQMFPPSLLQNKDKLDNLVKIPPEFLLHPAEIARSTF